MKSSPLLGRALVGPALAIVTLAGLLDPIVPGAGAQVTSDAPRPIDVAYTPDCDEFLPESYRLPGEDDTKKVLLDVYVLLDVKGGLKVADLQRRAALSGKRKLAARARSEFRILVDGARESLKKARTSYAPLNIKLNFKRWGLLKPLEDDGSPRRRTRDSQSIINLSREQLGGRRPRGVDVVYALTDLDLTAPGLGDAVAGQADCIGGVRYDQRAFAVGEIFQWENLPAGPFTFYYAATSKIAAHEIGHLMGAHHHYQDCVEGIPTELEEGEVSPCTLMSNAVDLQSLNFSLLEAAVVRGHALDFAAAND